MQGTEISGTANKLEEWAEAGHEQGGYFAALCFEPWEGARVRTKRSGQWGNYSNLVNNGDVVAFLGESSIEATAMEYERNGQSKEYTVAITPGE